MENIFNPETKLSDLANILIERIYELKRKKIEVQAQPLGMMRNW